LLLYCPNWDTKTILPLAVFWGDIRVGCRGVGESVREDKGLDITEGWLTGEVEDGLPLQPEQVNTITIIMIKTNSTSHTFLIMDQF
jgi:hypothetical protein